MADDLKQTVNELIQTHWELEGVTLSDHTTFESLGFDSLDTADLIIVIEEKLNVRLPKTALEQVDTLGQLVEVIRCHQSNS